VSGGVRLDDLIAGLERDGRAVPAERPPGRHRTAAAAAEPDAGPGTPARSAAAVLAASDALADAIGAPRIATAAVVLAWWAIVALARLIVGAVAGIVGALRGHRNDPAPRTGRGR
jgi:hypothetical protein